MSMPADKKDTTKTLVMDSGGFIRGYQHLDKLGTEYSMVTIPEVIGEIRDRKTREKLENAVFRVDYRQPSSQAIDLVTKFCKDTGDYSFLSAVDIKVLALSVTLEIEKNGMKFLTTKVAIPKVEQAVFRNMPESLLMNVPYSFVPAEDKEDTNKDNKNDETKLNPETNATQSNQDKKENNQDQAHTENSNDAKEDTSTNKDDTETPSEANKDAEHENNDVDNENNEDNENNDDNNESEFVLRKIEEEQPQEEEFHWGDDDDEGWITTENFDQMLNQSTAVKVVDDRVFVACCTTDFAMQNVLLQMGVQLLSVDGLQIRNVRNWILRCFACDKVSPDRERVFCKFCGNRTLRKISIFIDESGEVKYVLPRKQLTTYKTNFSIPKPKIGRANKPNDQYIVSEYQWEKANKTGNKRRDVDPFMIDEEAMFAKRKPNSRMDASNRLRLGPSSANRSSDKNKRNRRRK